MILLCGIKTLEQLWRFFGILRFCSSFVIILSCSMALVVSLSLIVFGCPSLSCCYWLSFMSLVVLGCHCLSLVEYGCLAVFGCLWYLVVLGILVDFGCLWCLWLSLVVFVCPRLYLFVLGLSSLVCESFVIMLSGRVGRRADVNIGFVAFTAKAELTFLSTSNLVKILLYEGCFFKLSAGKT